MKIGLVGFGYWGKIIFNNLIKLGYDDIVLCDSNIDNILNQNLTKKFKFVKDYKDMICDKVFVVVPTDKHYDIVSYFLNKNVDVFCEKPLTVSYLESEKLYELSEKTNAKLFVDWIFTFNPQIVRLKYIIENNNLKCRNIFLNRMNFGPERYDVNSIYDLSSHDVSIVSFLFDKYPEKINWISFKRSKKSLQYDSNVGVLEYDDFTVQINSSWFYSEKDRRCVFEFDEGFIYWDDNKKVFDVNFHIENDLHRDDNTSPLEESIESFIYSKFDSKKQKTLTLNIQKIIENNG